MKFILFIFYLLTRSLPKMLNERNYNKRIPDLFSGYDQRYLINRTTTEIYNRYNGTIINIHAINEEDTEQIYNFKKMFAQLALLHYLKRQDESEINKLKAIENPLEFKPNILGGGLFKDWNFTLFLM